MQNLKNSNMINRLQCGALYSLHYWNIIILVTRVKKSQQ